MLTISPRLTQVLPEGSGVGTGGDGGGGGGGGVFLSRGELRKWLRVKMWAKICHQGDKRVSLACYAKSLLKDLTCDPAVESLLSMYKALS